MKSKNLMIIAVLLFLSGSIFAQGRKVSDKVNSKIKDL